MIEAILAALRAQVRTRVRRVGKYAALGAITAVFVAIAVAALVGALFLWLEESLSPIQSALVIAAGALVLAIAFSGPLWWPKRRPPPRPDPSLAEFVALMAARGATFTPRQMALGAVFGALALGLMTAGKQKDAD